MKLKAVLLSVICVFVAAGSLFGAANTSSVLAEKAVSGSETEAAEAIRKLRESGPRGLDELFETYAADIRTYRETGTVGENWKKITAALDTVAMQKDAYAAQLYWYTDLEEAKRAAAAEHKPILSLRLLGNLNEEFSCANSRLFRSVLYTNRDVSKYLRENYILHWKSVRPAPRITIDFGDGRRIERTVTGNSIHYILDKSGRIIDALPGLYSPAAFLAYLVDGRRAGNSLDNVTTAQMNLILMRHRRAGFSRIQAKRFSSVALAKVELTEPKSGVDAVTAAPRAMSKMVVTDEISLLRVYDNFARFEPQIDLADWQKLADIYSPVVPIDAASRSFIRMQNAKTGLTDAEFAGMFARLEKFIALDTTRNDFLFRTKLAEWLNADPAAEIEPFNARVYDKIFQTPNSDKWLGLYSSDVYAALDGNGIVR